VKFRERIDLGESLHNLAEARLIGRMATSVNHADSDEVSDLPGFLFLTNSTPIQAAGERVP